MNKKRTQEEFVKQVNALNKGFTVVGEYTGARMPVNIQCENGHIWSARPTNLLSHNSGCPYCANKKILVGYNDMWTTAPEIAKLLVNPEDGYKYTKCSSEKTYFKCPDCGDISFKAISKVYTGGLMCQKCSDGISYPNKFARAFLSQLPVENIVYEYSPAWANMYRYDNYFEYKNNKYILEMDGGYHYVEKSVSKKSLKERQEDDRIKDNLAKQNGVDVIRINCSISEPSFIKNQILQSKLSDIFDLSQINWNICDEKSQKNLVRQACELYMLHLYTLSEIERQLHISRDTLHRYLKIGVRLGWCDYDPEKTKTFPKPIIIVDNDNNVIHRFSGVREAARQMGVMYNIKVYRHRMIEACKKHKPYKGFNFRLDDSYNTK